MSNLKQVAIVIPIYQEFISEFEAISLRQSESVLNSYPRIAIKPHHLTLPSSTNPESFTQIISFDDHFFSGIVGYNQLMLSPSFYEKFVEYEYILIYQLDAFVFTDLLSYWCNKGFDYIGAPWTRKDKSPNFFKSLILKAQQVVSTRFNLQKKGLPNKYQFEGKVGNGGLSLRKVKKFHNITLAMKATIDFYLSQAAYQYNEDAFWSIEVNRKTKQLNIPSYKEGLKFAFEKYPEIAYELNKSELPFGCHDWDAYIDFWRPIFKQYHFDI